MGFEPGSSGFGTIFAANYTMNSLTRGSREEALDPRVMCTSQQRIFTINKVSDTGDSLFGLRSVLSTYGL